VALIAHLALATRRKPRTALAAEDWKRLGCVLVATVAAVVILSGFETVR
jgi:hypothetical protein